MFTDLVLITVIVISHRIKLNPDNLATPMAASIGDVVSLIVLSTWARLLFRLHGKLIKFGRYVLNINYNKDDYNNNGKRYEL